jgi:hypothetical protein
MQEGKKF